MNRYAQTERPNYSRSVRRDDIIVMDAMVTYRDNQTRESTAFDSAILIAAGYTYEEIKETNSNISDVAEGIARYHKLIVDTAYDDDEDEEDSEGFDDDEEEDDITGQ